MRRCSHMISLGPVVAAAAAAQVCDIDVMFSPTSLLSETAVTEATNDDNATELLGTFNDTRPLKWQW